MEHFIEIGEDQFRVTPEIDDLPGEFYDEEGICNAETLDAKGFALEVRKKVGNVFTPAQLRKEGARYVVIPYSTGSDFSKKEVSVDIRSAERIEEEGITKIEIDSGRKPVQGGDLMIKVKKRFWIIKEKTKRSAPKKRRK
ncbi:MAG: hypothetical protein V1908_01485 [Candidatus Peregrinibacteria bacterium]